MSTLTVGMWVLAVLVVGSVVAMAVVLVTMSRRVQALEAGHARVDRMGEAMTLLSETAEAGFAAVAQEIEKLQRAPARTSGSRTTVSRRVVRAASRGESVTQIARREALSEGEVRLHLALAESATVVKKGGRRASVRA